MTRAGNGIIRASLAALLLASLGSAQEEDRPALGVARVSLTNGDVTIRRGDSGDWIQASVNTPLVEGDRIATGRASRAEVQLDYSNLLRLYESSEVNIANLSNRQFRVQVERGTVTYSELRGGEADVDVETPLVAVRPGKNGRYRIEVRGKDFVRVIVRKGEAEVASSQGVETLKQGRMMVVRRGAEGPEFAIEKADPKDDWDEFNQRRDKSLQKSESYRKLSRSIYGAEDLDDAGSWQYVSGYGNSWFPRVSYGWAPYRHGRWTWIDYYGWSWQSYERWGWAPYHYGRWFHHAHHGWGWYPGPYYGHHYWRPALVAFFGYGHYGGHHRFNFGFGFGGGHHYGYSHFGWIPLAPGERYYPWYGHGYGGYGGRHRGGHNTIYVDNSVNIYNNYRNARHHNAVSAIKGEAFARGRVGTPQALRPSELRQAGLMRGRLPIVPSRESRGRSASPTDFRRASTSSASGRQTRFFTANRGRATVQRASFQKQQERAAGSVQEFARTRSRNATGGTTAAATTRGAAGGAGLAATSTAARARTGSATRSSSVVRSPSSLGTSPTSTASRGATRGRVSGSTSGRQAGGQPAGGQQRTAPGLSGATTAETGSDRNRAAARTTTPGSSTRRTFQGFPRARGGSQGISSPPGASSLAPAGAGSSTPRTSTAATRSRAAGTSSRTSGWRRFGGSRPSAGGTTPSRAATGTASPQPPVRQRGGSSSRTFQLSRPVEQTTSGRRATSAPSTRSRAATRDGSPSGQGSFVPRSRSRATGPAPSTRGRGTSSTAGRSASPSSSPSRQFTPRSRSRVSSPRSSNRGNVQSNNSRSSSQRSSSRAGGFAPRSRSRVTSGSRTGRSSSPQLSRAPSRSSSPATRSRSYSPRRSSMPSSRSRPVSPARAPTMRSRGSMPRSSAPRGRMSAPRSSGSISRGSRSIGSSRGSTPRSSGGISRSRGSSRGRSRR